MPLAMLLLFLLFGECWARLVNVTIDDTYGDAQTGKKPEYLPKQGWLGLSDLALVHNRTASYALVPGNISMEFEGSMIYVFLAGIPPQQASWPGIPGAIVFYLDGDTAPAGKTVGPGIPGRFDQVHSQLTFTSDQLAPRRHSLVAVFYNGVVAFDYAVYTKEIQDSPASSVSIGQPTVAPSGHRSGGGNNPPTTHRPHGASALVGGSVAGAIALIGLSSWILVWRCRRRRRRRAARERGRTESADETAPQSGAGSCSDDATSPFIARPTGEDAVPQAASEKSDAWQSAVTKATAHAHADAGPRRVARGAIAPSNLHSGPAAAVEAREEDTFKAEDIRPRAMDTAADESPADIRAELQRMRTENERARAENERARAEIEHLRQVAQAAEPPPYSDGGRSEYDDGIR